MFLWQWGDGSATSTGAGPSHSFPAQGTYTVKVTATFADGWTATDQHAVSVGRAPKKSGYWMLGSDGKVYPFGYAPSLGSAPSGAIAIAARADGTGYWILGRDGSVRAFGSASFVGDHPALPFGDSVATISDTPSGHGYWIFTHKGRAADQCRGLGSTGTRGRHAGGFKGRRGGLPARDRRSAARGRQTGLDHPGPAAV